MEGGGREGGREEGERRERGRGGKRGRREGGRERERRGRGEGGGRTSNSSLTTNVLCDPEKIITAAINQVIAIILYFRGLFSLPETY